MDDEVLALTRALVGGSLSDEAGLAAFDTQPTLQILPEARSSVRGQALAPGTPIAWGSTSACRLAC
jgi:hypothetical protein